MPPPSTTSAEPVTHGDMPLHRKNTHMATSSGVPSRSMGVCCRRPSITLGDIARAMVYLADAAFVTGQVLPVNGGFVIT